MKKNRQNKLVYLVFLFVLTLSGCGFLNIMNYGSLLLGSNDVGGNAASINLDDTETELVSDGPIDLPVTIAKYDSPDANKISIEEMGPANSVSSSYQTTGRRIRITGSEDAIRDLLKTPLVTAFPYDSASNEVGTQTEVAVDSDGSFEIEVESDGDVLIAAEDTNNFISPFLQITQDPVTGYFSIITTNSNYIVATTQMMADQEDYYYVSLKTSDPIRTYVRRNVDGSQMQTLLLDSAIVIDALYARSSAKTVYSYESAADEASLVLQLNSIASSSVNQSQLTTVNSQSVFEQIVSYSYDLGTITPYDYSEDNFKIYISDDEAGVIIVNRSDVSVQYVSTVSGNVSDIVSSGRYDDVDAGYDIANNILYVGILRDGLYSIYQLDLGDGDASLAWGGRVAINEFVIYDGLLSMDAADGVLVYSVQSGDSVQLYSWDETHGVVALNDPETDSSIYTNPKVSLDGDVILACKLATTNQFVAFDPIVSGSVSDVTTDSRRTVCDATPGSYFMGENFVHFYRSEADGSLPQHAIIKLDQL